MGRKLHELFYRLQNIFSPGGQKHGISQFLGSNIGISHYFDRRGKNCFEVGRVAHEVPSRISRAYLSLKLTKLRVHEVYVPQDLKNWPKTVNFEKSSIIVPPGEKSF